MDSAADRRRSPSAHGRGDAATAITRFTGAVGQGLPSGRARTATTVTPHPVAVRLIDSHVHLQAERFAQDAADVLGAARAAGVERILVPGWDVDSSEAAAAFAREHGVDAAAGVHPHAAGALDPSAWPRIVELARSHRVSAIGETGLDYDREFSPRAVQQENLRSHLTLAIELDLPIILHCRSARGARDAQDDLLHELERAAGVRPLIHSFSGPVDYADEILRLGAWLSFSGLVFRRGEETAGDVARLVPADRLLVETDSPYLPPPGAPRRRNEPRWVAVTARWLAEQRGDDSEQLGGQLVANYDALLGSPRG